MNFSLNFRLLNPLPTQQLHLDVYKNHLVANLQIFSHKSRPPVVLIQTKNVESFFSFSLFHTSFLIHHKSCQYHYHSLTISYHLFVTILSKQPAFLT